MYLLVLGVPYIQIVIEQDRIPMHLLHYISPFSRDCKLGYLCPKPGFRFSGSSKLCFGFVTSHAVIAD